jgi:hypothetical protein
MIGNSEVDRKEPVIHWQIANSLTDNGIRTTCRKVCLSNMCLSQSLGGDKSVSLMTVKAFTEHVLREISAWQKKLLAHYDHEKDFSLEKLRRSQYFG